MADANVEVTEGSGKKVDTRTNSQGDHRQVIVLGDALADSVIEASDLLARLTSISDNTDGLEGFTDGLEALLTDIKGFTDGIEGLLTTIRDNADTVEIKLQAIADNTDGLEGFTDGIEGLLVTIRDNADAVETKLDSIITNTADLEGFVDGIEGLLTSIRDNADTVETKLQSIIDVDGATGDAAVTTDASGTISGKLRGLIKWAFERMPASLGQKTKANSFPVVLSSDQEFFDTFEADHRTLVASTDTTLTFTGFRMIRVLNWDTANRVLVKDGAITSDSDSSATRVGKAPTDDVPSSRSIPINGTTIHVRSAATSEITVEAYI